MKCLYVNEFTNETYSTEEECNKAEEQYREALKKEENLAKEKAKRAKEIEDALDVANKEYDKAIELLKEFIKDYGSFSSKNLSNNFGKNLFDFFGLFK